MQARAIDYVVYGVSSLEKALPFYRDVLGLRLLSDFGGVWAEFDVAPTTLAISGPPYGQPPKEGYQGGATVALAVPDVKAAVEELRGKGVPIAWGPQETPVCFMAGITDPDGNHLLLHQRKDGTAG